MPDADGRVSDDEVEAMLASLHEARDAVMRSAKIARSFRPRHAASADEAIWMGTAHGSLATLESNFTLFIVALERIKYARRSGRRAPHE